TDEQLDFPILYASGLSGYASLDEEVYEGDMRPLFEAIIKHVPQREDDVEGPLQLQICSLDYRSYVGQIGIGRVNRGRLLAGQEGLVMHGREGEHRTASRNHVLECPGLQHAPVEEAVAGDILLINGIDDLAIGCTVADVEQSEGLALVIIAEPTLRMTFLVDTPPLAGREGKFLTSR